MERDIFNVCHISINPNKRDIKPLNKNDLSARESRGSNLKKQSQHHYENLLKNK